MIKEALEYLHGLARPPLVEIGERRYSTSGLTPVKEPVPDAIQLRTLTGLVDYLRENIDELSLCRHLLCVQSEKAVVLVSEIFDHFEQRKVHIAAQADVPDQRFGRFMPHEEFMIWIQTHFVQDEVTAAVQRMVGNITESATARTCDDGVTQETTARRGIAGVENVAVPNPVELAPRRAFAEIEQPASKFVLRIRRGGGAVATVEAALFEADGGAWRNEAIKRVAEYLRAAGVAPKVIA